MKALLMTFGSSGDVNPFVGLGTALKSRGHHVTVATNPYFEDLVRRAGLPFQPIGTQEDFLRTLDHPDLWHPQRGLRFVMREGVVPLLHPSYDLAHRFIQEGGHLVIASVLALGARLAQEKFGLPLATVHLQPQAIMSVDATPVYPQKDISHWPRFLKKMAFRMGDIAVDRLLAPELPALRRQLGLPPLQRVFYRWVHSPDLTIGLWPEWFAEPQKDWPRQIRLTSFPLYDASNVEPVPPALETFIKAGPAPVIFTAGSAMRQGRRFFEESVAACQRLGCRGLLLTRFPEQVPAGLPSTIRQFGYIPFSQILPHAAAFIHHGGIGTTAQAFATGVPQIVMPLSHDQPDNAARVQRAGAGFVLPVKNYTATRLTPLLQNVLHDSTIRSACQTFADRLRGQNGLTQTCELLEERFR